MTHPTSRVLNKQRYSVTKSTRGWSVWDDHEYVAMASFDSRFDAETCQAACEIVRSDVQNERPAHEAPDEPAPAEGAQG